MLDHGTFTTHIKGDEYQVQWSWYEGDDWDADGFFDIFVSKDGIDVTYDISKLYFQWIEQEVKEESGYTPPSRQRVARAINGYFNKTF